MYNECKVESWRVNRMKIYVLNQVMEYDNNKDVIKEIFEKGKKIIFDSNYTFSHLNVDGIDVYDDFYDYISDNIKNIKEIKFVAKMFNEIIQDVIVSTYDYIENSLPEIRILSNEFYTTPNQEAWGKLVDLFEGITWIMDTFEVIDKNDNIKDIVKSYETWNLYAKDIYSLKELMVEFEEILSSEDLVSIGDILSYEIIPLFESMKEKLNVLVDRRVEVHDLN
jgi:hypothetical protein